jgi:cell division protein FtsL
MSRFACLFFWVSLAIAASVGLYHTSYRVHDLGLQLHNVNLAIEAEQRNIHVLKAEWVYLSNPEKIEVAAKKHLALRATSLQQIARVESLPDVLPSRLASAGDRSAAPMAFPSPVATVSASSDDDKYHVNTRMKMTGVGVSGASMVLAGIGAHP